MSRATAAIISAVRESWSWGSAPITQVCAWPSSSPSATLSSAACLTLLAVPSVRSVSPGPCDSVVGSGLPAVELPSGAVGRCFKLERDALGVVFQVCAELDCGQFTNLLFGVVHAALLPDAGADLLHDVLDVDRVGSDSEIRHND